MSRKSRGSSVVEENVKLLMQDLSTLMRFRPEGGEDNRWSEILQGQELEIHSLLNEYFELKNGTVPNNMNAELELNRKVMKVMKYVKVLQECIIVETSQRELVAQKPKIYFYEDLQSFTLNFSNQIGGGGYGKVYKGKFPDGVKLAVKVLKKGDDVEEIFIAELSTMGRIYHPYLIKLYGYCFDKKMKALVYEYMEKGSFDTVLYSNPHGLDWKKFYEIAVNIAEGLSYLHHGCPEPIIHHDIKTANVLIDSNLSPKITDFGLAMRMKNGATHLTNSSMRGTYSFIAPELFYPWSSATPKCDVYSYGMLLFEILGMRGNNRNEEWFPNQVWEKFKAGKLDDILGNCGISKENSEDAKLLSTVALWCAQISPKSRPSMSIVVQMLQKEMHVKSPRDPFSPSVESSLETIQEWDYQEEVEIDVTCSISQFEAVHDWDYVKAEVGNDVICSISGFSEYNRSWSWMTRCLSFLCMGPSVKEEAEYSESQQITEMPQIHDAQSGITEMYEATRYSSKDIANFTSDYSTQIGSSPFWKIYKGKSSGGVEVTVNVLEENNVSEEMFMDAVSTQDILDHPHLVKLYGYCSDPEMKALVYEYLEKGSLDKILYGNPHGLDWKKFYEIAVNIAAGLSHLHAYGEIHHDVKASNVLIDSDYSPKITNFGLVKLMNIGARHHANSGMRGYVSHVAPEVLYPWSPVSSKCDVYSFGMLLFEILEMKANSQSEGMFPKRVWEMFEAGKLDEIFEDCGISEESRKYANILSMVALWCAQFTPKLRPSMRDVVMMLEEDMPVPIPHNPFWPSEELSTSTARDER